MLQFLYMVILEAVHSFIVAVLIGYLSFTNALALQIERYLPQPPVGTPIEVLSEHQVSKEPSEELTLLSRLYATSAGVTRILRDDQTFQDALAAQQAAVAAYESKPVTKESIIASLVNILCEYKTDEYTRTTTGTGFFVDERGVILTNAHVAQFLLLEHADADVGEAGCIIRSGDPAVPRFSAELLFLSPTWMLNNSELITEEMPRGTGEYDYALLYVTDSLDTDPLPSSYSSLPLNTEFLARSLAGTEVFIAGYPAEKLFREGARAELVPKVAETTVEELYTFESNYADIFSLAASQVGEHGSSGGPVVNSESGAFGLIVTKGDVEKEGPKSLRALSLSYIDRTITEETGFSLTQNMGGDLRSRGKIFKQALAPYLGQLLAFELD